MQDDKWHINEQAVDYVYCNEIPNFDLPGTLHIICEAKIWQNQNQVFPIFNSLSEFQLANAVSDQLNFIRVDASDLSVIKAYQSLKNNHKIVFVLSSKSSHGMAEQRRFYIELMHQNVNLPVLNQRRYENLDNESFQLFSSTDLGALLIDGMGDGIWIETENCANLQLVTSKAFGILQATRTRISKTDYISCPSCGRTLFDLQSTTAKIRAKTSHLKGLKIGIMGCIVNGPGEMADADYGYVGVGKGKINLYKERTVVKKNIPEADAVDQLVELIREYGDWVEVKSN